MSSIDASQNKVVLHRSTDSYIPVLQWPGPAPLPKYALLSSCPSSQCGLAPLMLLEKHSLSPWETLCCKACTDWAFRENQTRNLTTALSNCQRAASGIAAVNCVNALQLAGWPAVHNEMNGNSHDVGNVVN